MSVCSKCHAGCCRRFNINLTGYDILKIKNSLDLDLHIFTQLNPVNLEEKEKIAKNAALFKFSDLDYDKYYRFCLRLVKSSIFPDSYKCMFLQEWNNEILGLSKSDQVISRCGIYGTRPLACSVYPGELSKDGLVGLTGDPSLFLAKSDNPAYELCPGPVNKDDFTDKTEDGVHKLILFNYEMDFFKSAAEVWNENPGKISEFLSYIKLTYKNRILFQQPDKEEEL